MNVFGIQIRFNQCDWFAERCPDILSASNATEREIRLRWLSEGLLARNLHPDTSGKRADEVTSQRETELFWEFVFHTVCPNRADLRPRLVTAEAVSEAVAALYFDDSFDYRAALLSVLSLIAPEAHRAVLSNPASAYRRYCKPIQETT